MNLKAIKKIIFTATLLAAFAMTVSSCNRGIGCPSDFSVKQVVQPVVSSILQVY
jgi:predicted small secreted protein